MLPTVSCEGHNPPEDDLDLQVTKSEFSDLSAMVWLPCSVSHRSPKSFNYMSDELSFPYCLPAPQSLIFPSLSPRRKSALSLTHCHVYLAPSCCWVFAPQIQCCFLTPPLDFWLYPVYSLYPTSLSEIFLYLFEDYPSLKVIININDKICSRRQSTYS